MGGKLVNRKVSMMALKSDNKTETLAVLNLVLRSVVL